MICTDQNNQRRQPTALPLPAMFPVMTSFPASSYSISDAVFCLFHFQWRQRLITIPFPATTPTTILSSRPRSTTSSPFHSGLPPRLLHPPKTQAHNQQQDFQYQTQNKTIFFHFSSTPSQSRGKEWMTDRPRFQGPCLELRRGSSHPTGKRPP